MRKNISQKIIINGQWLTEKRGIKQGVLEAFKVLLSDPRDWKVSPLGLEFSTINDSGDVSLELPFTEEEILDTLYYLNGDKAPGPNGYTAALWQFNLDTVKEKVISMFRDFQANGRFV